MDRKKRRIQKRRVRRVGVMLASVVVLGATAGLSGAAFAGGGGTPGTVGGFGQGGGSENSGGGGGGGAVNDGGGHEHVSGSVGSGFIFTTGGGGRGYENGAFTYHADLGFCTETGTGRITDCPYED